MKCLGRQRTRVFAGFPKSTHRFLPHVVPELRPQSKKRAQLPLLRTVFLKVIIPCLTLSEKSEHTSFPTAKLNADDDCLALARGCLKLLSGSRVESGAQISQGAGCRALSDPARALAAACLWAGADPTQTKGPSRLAQSPDVSLPASETSPFITGSKDPKRLSVLDSQIRKPRRPWPLSPGLVVRVWCRLIPVRSL